MDARSSEPTVDRFKHVLQDQGLRGQSAARGGRVIPIRLWWSAHQARSIAGTIPHPTMSDFLLHGVTDHVAEVREELGRLAEHAPADVASTAKALSELAEGQGLIIITDGIS